MKHRTFVVPLLLALAWRLETAFAQQTSARAAKPASSSGKVYGEWRIRIRPDQGPAYNELIKTKGLPLFRQAGGRMVGWWTTLVGDLYEQVTLWEYDDIAAFEKAVQFLGSEPRFKEFVTLRDPLLAGEENRFLRLTPGGQAPTLSEPARFVVHEIHRVPLRQMDAYRKFVEREALPLLKSHGFRPVGPWATELGKWTEVTYLFPYESLAERDRLIGEFMASPRGPAYSQKVSEFVDEITTRVLMPAPFAR